MQTDKTNDTANDNQNNNSENTPNTPNYSNSFHSSSMTDEGNQISRNNQKDSPRGWKSWYKLCLETFGLMIALLIAIFTYLTFKEIAKQTKTNITNSQITQRAYLKIGEAKEILVNDYNSSITEHLRELQIPLINFGHVPCNKIIASLIYSISDLKTNNINQKPDSINTACVIPPNEITEYFVGARLPNLSDSIFQKIKRGTLLQTISGKIFYDTGFNKFDTLYVCFSYAFPSDNWVQCDKVGLTLQMHKEEYYNNKKK